MSMYLIYIVCTYLYLITAQQWYNVTYPHQIERRYIKGKIIADRSKISDIWQLSTPVLEQLLKLPVMGLIGTKLAHVCLDTQSIELNAYFAAMRRPSTPGPVLVLLSQDCWISLYWHTPPQNVESAQLIRKNRQNFVR